MKSIFKSQYLYALQDKKSGEYKAVLADFNFTDFNINFFVDLQEYNIIDNCRPTINISENKIDVEYDSGKTIMDAYYKAFAESKRKFREPKIDKIQIDCDQFKKILQNYNLFEELLKRVSQYNDMNLTSHIKSIFFK